MPTIRPIDPRAILIAATGPSWNLYHRAFADLPPWRSLYLRRSGHRRDVPKRTYWLYWNGETLKRGKDALILQQHNPDIYDWVVAQCTAKPWNPLPDLDPPMHCVHPDNSRDWISEVCMLQLSTFSHTVPHPSR